MLNKSNSGERILIQIAAPEHAVALSHLNKLFNDVVIDPSEMASRLEEENSPEIALIAWYGSKVVAFAGLRIVVTLFYNSPHAELTELFVQEEYRQKGIGSSLLEKAIEVAKKRGATELMVITDLENIPARSLYEKLGFLDLDLCLTKSLS